MGAVSRSCGCLDIRSVGERADGELHREHSRCVQAGQLTPAECTDHSDGHSRADDRETFYDERRLQSLCSNCNRLKAIDLEGGFGRSTSRDSDITSRPARQNRLAARFLEPQVH